MPREHYKLFSQASLANLTIKNRLVRSATYEAAAADGTVTERHIEMYRALAEGGVGLIITGHMAAMPGGRTGPMQTCIYEDAHVEGIARIVDTVRSAGNGLIPSDRPKRRESTGPKTIPATRPSTLSIRTTWDIDLPLSPCKTQTKLHSHPQASGIPRGERLRVQFADS